MVTVPSIGNKKPDQQTCQSQRGHRSVAKAQRSAGRTSCAELKQAPQTVVAGCDMIYTPIGKRNISGTFCIRFQKGIVNTLRGLVSTWLSTGIGFNLSEEPFFRV
jgi:hypothetical protein